MTAEDRKSQKPPGNLWRFLPVVLIVAAIGAVFAFDLHQYLSFSVLADNRERLLAWTADNRVMAAVGFTFLYCVATALSIPGAVWLTLAGGFIFGTWEAAVYVTVGATAGACLIFLAAKTAFHDLLLDKAGKFIKKLEQGFKQDATSYLLFLRLVPVFPFWVVNLVPAFLGMSLGRFALGTLVGILPGVIVYCSVGNGLGAVIDQGGKPDLGIIFEPQILLPLLGLALLALLPIGLKKFKRAPVPDAARDDLKEKTSE